MVPLGPWLAAPMENGGMMRRIAMVAVGLVVGLVAGGGIVWATIPNSTTGAASACYPTSGPSKGVLRVIDAQAGQTCAAGEASIVLSTPVCNGYPRGGVDWHGCDFRNTNLQGQYLNASQLQGTNLTAAKLSGASLVGANLTGANLSRGTLSGADLRNAVLSGANLSKATLAGSVTTSALRTNLTGAVGLTSAGLRGVSQTVFASSRPAHCGSGFIYGPNLALTDFTGMDFTAFDLSRTVLEGASLTNANFTNANLDCMFGQGGSGPPGAIYSNTTCPDGTNSDNNGGTCGGHF
jgi:uncharacterized protein YjbI with pentapeptide repeats